MSLSLMACQQGRFDSISMPLENTTKASSNNSSSGGSVDASAPQVVQPPSQGSSSGSSNVSSSGSGSSSSQVTPPSSGSSSSSVATTSTWSSRPTTTCKNMKSGNLDFRIMSQESQMGTFKSMVITSITNTQRGAIEGYVLYREANGIITYEDESVEAFINNESWDDFYKCNIGYSEISNLAAKKGFSSITAAIPNLVLEVWTEVPTAQRLPVGLALRTANSNEFAIQCY